MMQFASSRLHFTDILPAYYERLFPGELMYRWLSYGDADIFSRREFSFTLVGDVYIRYQSFISDKDFVAELKKRKPEKIDIGAVCNHKPNKRGMGIFFDFTPLQKEFVLDIDLTDYDDVRTCSKKAKVCDKCWKFIALAVKILDASLRSDFGFEHLLWVFSGRRGAHCWVCDDSAINLTPYGRAAIVEYLTVIGGGENQAKKVSIDCVDNLHPFLSRSIDMIDEVFEEICHDDQNLLEKGDKNFYILPDNVRKVTWYSDDRFNAVMRLLNNKAEKNKNGNVDLPFVEKEVRENSVGRAKAPTCQRVNVASIWRTIKRRPLLLSSKFLNAL